MPYGSDLPEDAMDVFFGDGCPRDLFSASSAGGTIPGKKIFMNGLLFSVGRRAGRSFCDQS
jgi:hypothetical protein